MYAYREILPHFLPSLTFPLTPRTYLEVNCVLDDISVFISRGEPELPRVRVLVHTEVAGRIINGNIRVGRNGGLG